LKFEPRHESDLANFLLERALKNPTIIGHAFFWALKGNLGNRKSYERYYLILERYLMLCGGYREDLYR